MNTEYRIQNTEYTVSRDWNPDLIHKVEKYMQYQHVLVWGFYSAAIRGECPAVISRTHITDWLITTELYKNKKEKTAAADQQVVEYIYQKLIEIHDSADRKSKVSREGIE